MTAAIPLTLVGLPVGILHKKLMEQSLRFRDLHAIEAQELWLAIFISYRKAHVESAKQLLYSLPMAPPKINFDPGLSSFLTRIDSALITDFAFSSLNAFLLKRHKRSS